MASTLQPETILKEMSRLWTTRGEKTGGQGEGVLRACTMTLIAVTHDSGDVAALSATLGEIMRNHPSRAIVLRLSQEDRAPEAQVVAQCWMPFGQREQICCEQVEIGAGFSALADLKPFLLALVASDLPVVLWLRGPLDFDSGAFKEIVPLAGKVIVDSSSWPDAGAALGKVAAASGAGRRIADLSWARLTRWREMVAQMFEHCTCESRIAEFSEIEIEHGGDRVPSAAWYLAAWLARGLGWRFEAGQWTARERERTVRFRPAAGWGYGSVSGLRMTAGEFEVLIHRTEETVIELIAGDLRSRGVLPRPTEALLLGEELSIGARDRVFEEVLPVASALARSTR